MKKLLLCAVMFSLSIPALAAEKTCKVTVCNKIERFSLSPWSHMKDSMGKTCFVAIIPASEAVVDHILSSDSRWYQGSSINPTKKSVTRVAEVHTCE